MLTRRQADVPAHVQQNAAWVSIGAMNGKRQLLRRSDTILDIAFVQSKFPPGNLGQRELL